MQPAVSVVMPIYNASKFLRESMDSVVNQTLTNLEIICVNDGSTDDSLEILRSYAESDQRIRIIDKPNAGYGHSMNVGLDNCTGEFFAILEPDDYVSTSMYKELYEIASKNNLDFIRSDFYRFRDRANDRKMYYHELTLNQSYYNKILSPQDNLDLFNVRMQNWTGLYSVDFLNRNQIRFHESPGASYQDNGFWFQTYCYAKKIYLVNKPYYYYRWDNPASSTKQNNKVYAMLDEYKWIREEILEKHPLLKERFMGIYQYKKMHNCDFGFSLLAKEYRMPFLMRYSEEYKEARDAGEINPSFFTPFEWEHLLQIINSPEAYCEEYNLNEPNLIRQAKYTEELEDAKDKNILATIACYFKYETVPDLIRKVIWKFVGAPLFESDEIENTNQSKE